MNDLSRLAAALGGLPVLGCLEGSPAAESGMRYGDILLALDDMPMTNWNDFIEARSQSKGGFVARIFRDGAEIDIRVTLRKTYPKAAEVLGELAGRQIAQTGGVDDGEPN
jgi:S1-C subfamily serine protease